MSHFLLDLPTRSKTFTSSLITKKAHSVVDYQLPEREEEGNNFFATQAHSPCNSYDYYDPGSRSNDNIFNYNKFNYIGNKVKTYLSSRSASMPVKFVGAVPRNYSNYPSSSYAANFSDYPEDTPEKDNCRLAPLPQHSRARRLSRELIATVDSIRDIIQDVRSRLSHTNSVDSWQNLPLLSSSFQSNRSSEKQDYSSSMNTQQGRIARRNTIVQFDLNDKSKLAVVNELDSLCQQESREIRSCSDDDDDDDDGESSTGSERSNNLTTNLEADDSLTKCKSTNKGSTDNRNCIATTTTTQINRKCCHKNCKNLKQLPVRSNSNSATTTAVISTQVETVPAISTAITTPCLTTSTTDPSSIKTESYDTTTVAPETSTSTSITSDSVTIVASTTTTLATACDTIESTAVTVASSSSVVSSDGANNIVDVENEKASSDTAVDCSPDTGNCSEYTLRHPKRTLGTRSLSSETAPEEKAGELKHFSLK